MNGLERMLQVLFKLGAWVAGALLVFTAAHTMVEIVARLFFGRSTFSLVEFTGYALAAMTFLSLAQTMRDGSLVRVNVLLKALPAAAQRGLEVVALTGTIALTCFAAWFVWVGIQRNFVRGYASDGMIAVPLWIPPLPMLIGMSLFILATALQLISTLRGGPLLADQAEEI